MVICLADGLNFEGTLQLERLNYANVVLIPKKSGAREVGDFRPISALNASVKIISKILANRLREILGGIIEDHHHQSGFLKGKNTVEVIATA